MNIKNNIKVFKSFISKNYKYLIIFLIILFIINYFYKINYRNYDDKTGVNQIAHVRGEIGIENYQNLNPAKLNNKMSNIDNIKFNNKNKKHHLLENNLIVPQGNTIPLKLEKQYQLSLGPNVDGTKKSSKNMFMFAYNQCKPSCCPATYSCSGGCICTTNNQNKFLSKRGNNKNFPNNGL